MKQELIEIGEVLVPVIIDDKGMKWYPIVYVSEKVLLRQGTIIPKGNKNHNYNEYVNFFKVDYTFMNGGLQNTKCINTKGLNLILKNSRIGRLSVEQRKAQNELHEYLGIDLISEEPRFLDNYPQSKIDLYPLFIQDAIADVLEENLKIKWQRCTKCTNYYPYHLNFFKENQSSPEGIDTYCRNCKVLDHNRSKNGMIKRNNEELNKIYNKYGDELYVAFKEDNLIKIYNAVLGRIITFIPDCYRNKNDYLRIIKWLYENKHINKHNISLTNLINYYRLINLNDLITIHEIYTLLFGEEYYLCPWEFNYFQFKDEIKLTYDIANEVFSNYIETFNIDISDPLTLDYEDLIRKAKLTQVMDMGSVLYFAVQYNKFKHPGYKFKTRSVNYYKDIDNLKFDLKYFVENDLKIKPYKIPLYIKKWTLKRDCQPLSSAIGSYQHLFQVVNEIYPHMFDENDFKLSYTLGSFESDIEYEIDQILRISFKNVIYNQRDRDDTITLDRCIPDWIILTENGVWIVEYLGMYLPDRKGTNSLIDTYLEKAEKKFVKYEELKGYNLLYLLPEDVEDDYEGVKNKIKRIK